MRHTMLYKNKFVSMRDKLMCSVYDKYLYSITFQMYRIIILYLHV